MSYKVKDFMTVSPTTIGHDIKVEKAIKFMAEHDCHHLPVLDDKHLVGIVSARDLKLTESIPSGEKTAVENVMTDEPLVVDPDQDLKEVLKTMLEKHIGSVIVSAKEGHQWGIFTTTDAMKLLIEKI